MAEKTDWAKLSKKELQEMLLRQEKLLANKKFLQSLPDKGKKVTETVAKLKELIARKEQLEDTVAQFERMTVSRLVQRTQTFDILDSDDSDNEMLVPEQEAIVSPAEVKVDALSAGTDNSPVETSHHRHDNSNTKNKQTSVTSSKKWNHESSATPPQYKLEKAKPISLDESFKLLRDQEKKHKELQAQHATLKLREQGFVTGADHITLQVVQNPLHLEFVTTEEHNKREISVVGRSGCGLSINVKYVTEGTNAAKHCGYFPACSAVVMLKIEARYQETVHDDYLSDESDQEENDAKNTVIDSDDDD